MNNTNQNEQAPANAEQRSVQKTPMAKQMDFIQAINALESFPGGKEFIKALRALSGEIAITRRYEMSQVAMRVAKANLPEAQGEQVQLW